jgi:hypothetical protein
MKSQTITSTLGALMFLACGATGFIDSLLLSGAGICGGFPMTWGIIGFGIVTALLPAGTVGIFSGPWWISSVIYSTPLFFAMVAAASTGEWYRVIASIGCVALAFGGAWLCKPRSKKRI